MKDVALARTMEDSTFACLNTLILRDQLEISEALAKDDEYMTQVFKLISDESTPSEKVLQGMDFIQELCTMSKSFSRESRQNLFQSLVDHGLYSIMDRDLLLFFNVVEHNPLPVRADLMNRKEVCKSIIKRFNGEDVDDGVSQHIIEICKQLLDTVGTTIAVPPPSGPALDRFLGYFYEECAPDLFSSLEQIEASKIATLNVNQSVMLLDFLSYLVVQNGMFCKNYLVSGQLFKKVSLLLVLPGVANYLRLAALRLFKTCLALNDEFYRRLLIKQEIVGKIAECLISTNGKNNLLNSACLEFFQLILNVRIFFDDRATV
jgi:protein phosphatase-4 regulatory subunit 3